MYLPLSQLEINTGIALDHSSWPHCVPRDPLTSKFSGHAQSNHRHTEFGDVVSRMAGHVIEVEDDRGAHVDDPTKMVRLHMRQACLQQNPEHSKRKINQEM